MHMESKSYVCRLKTYLSNFSIITNGKDIAKIKIFFFLDFWSQILEMATKIFNHVNPKIKSPSNILISILVMRKMGVARKLEIFLSQVDKFALKFFYRPKFIIKIKVQSIEL